MLHIPGIIDSVTLCYTVTTTLLHCKMTCCIKGCNSRRGRNESVKKSFFSVCTNKSWHDILCNRSTNITKNSKICELHFKPEEIIKEDAFLQTDGTVIHVEREKPKLKEGAVPSIFPTMNTVVPYYREIQHSHFIYAVKHLSTSHATNSTTQIEDSNSVYADQIPSTLPVINSTTQIEDSNSDYTDQIPSTLHAINSTTQIEDSNSVNADQIPSTLHTISSTTQIEDRYVMPEEEKTKFSIEDMNIAKNIKVPTSCWFANITDSHLMWTCWAHDLSCIVRRVIVKTNMKVQVFIGEQDVSFNTKVINNIQEIKQILMTVQNFFPCENVNNKDRNKNCQGFVIIKKYKINKRIWCLPCVKNWKALLRKKHNIQKKWRKLYTFFADLSTVFDKVDAVKLQKIMEKKK